MVAQEVMHIAMADSKRRIVNFFIFFKSLFSPCPQVSDWNTHIKSVGQYFYSLSEAFDNLNNTNNKVKPTQNVDVYALLLCYF